MSNTNNPIYDALSCERKELIAKGLAPEWYITAGWSVFKQRYLWAENPREQYKVIAATLASHYKGTPFEDEAETRFFDMMWKGDLSPSTPALANTGSGKGMPVSCAGSYIPDSVYGFYDSRLETAVLTQMGHGTSGYFGDIRPRGSKISGGGEASGTMPILLGFTQDMQLVKQNKSRRGAFAGYLPIQHGDFDEWADKLHHDGDKLNVGWIINDAFIADLNRGDSEALRRYQKMLHVKMVTGKGYMFFVDKVNRARPQAYVNNDLKVKASNLCDEITLFSDKDHTFTCVLSTMNLANFDADRWKSEDTIFWSTIFLNAVALEYIKLGEDKPGMERAMRFTKKSMALGLGQMGFHTYIQKQGWAWSSLEAMYFNTNIAKLIHEESNRASRALAQVMGEPEWAKGTGKANTHLTCCPPNKTTAMIMGGVSEGINPDAKLVFNQSYGGGEVKRIIPGFLNLLKEKNLYNDEILTQVRDNNGSIRGMDDLFTKDEQNLYATAFEINQRDILRYAAQRQKYIDQGQSVNLFIRGNESEEYVSALHQEAFMNEDIHGLYYIYSTLGDEKTTNTEPVCVSCEG